MRDFLNQLYRRNVMRTTSAYLAFAWLMIELAHLADHALGVSGVAQRWLMIFLCIGLMPTISFSWRYELTHEGVKEEEKIPKPKRVHHRFATTLDRITFALLAVAFIVSVVDQMAIEKVSPHDYPTIRDAARQTGNSDSSR